MAITPVKPYSFHCAQSRWPLGRPTYTIFFEDTQMNDLTAGSTEEDASRIVFLLNAAFEVGYSTGFVDARYGPGAGLRKAA